MLGHGVCFVLQPRQNLLFPDCWGSSRLLAQGHTEMLWHGQELWFGSSIPISACTEDEIRAPAAVSPCALSG